jgi:hypothetical protein
MKFISIGRASSLRAAVFTLIVASLPTSHAQTFWTGPNTNYVHSLADAADPLNPASTDRLTPNVSITRATTFGIFNAVTQTDYGSSHTDGTGTPDGSPSDTEWALGSINDYASLTYGSWFSMLHGARGVGQPAVLHLISDNIYVSIVFTTFDSGGTYTYTRSTPAAAVAPIVLTSPAISNNHFSFRYTANTGLTYVVQSSSNLLNWLPVSTNTATNSPVIFTDSSGLSAHRFYRIVH